MSDLPTARPLRAKRLLLVLVAGLAACHHPVRLALPDSGIARAPDGRVAFVRPTPHDSIPTSLGMEQATELWIADADGGHPRRLVRGSAGKTVERSLAAMSSPQFSPDGRRIYFLSRAWVTSDAVHAVDVASGREWYVAPGNSVAVIPRGPLAGCLLAGQHRYRPDAGGSTNWTWLLATGGQEIALAATDSAGADRRVATWMSGRIPDGAPPALATASRDARCR